MSVRKRRGKEWFYRKWVKLPHGGRIRAFGTPREYGLSNTKAGAEEAMRRKIGELMGDRPPPPKPAAKSEIRTVREFAPTYLEHSTTNDKPSTRQTKATLFARHILPELGELPLDEVNFAAFEDLKTALGRPRVVVINEKRINVIAQGPKSTNNILSTLHDMLDLAVKRHVIAHAPSVEWLAVEDPDFDFLTFDEAEALQRAADQDGEWGVMVLVGLRCGLRQGELIGLQWADLDLKKGEMRVRRTVYRGKVGTPKGGRSRTLPLGDDAIRVLKAHRHLRSEWVFCDLAGKRYTDGRCKHPLWRACALAGLRRIGWHVLRHTFASHLAMRGAPLRHIQELLGHSTIKMTERYAHLMPEAKRDVVQLLDRGAQMVPKR